MNSSLAYFAGFLDRSCFMGINGFRPGRGSTKLRYRAVVRVQATRRDILEPLLLFGGRIDPADKNRSFAWVLQGKPNCCRVLGCLLPYLRFRKKSAENILKFCLDDERVNDQTLIWDDLRDEVKNKRKEVVEAASELRMKL